MEPQLATNLTYYVAASTPGTPIVFAVNAAVSETAGYFLSIKNNAVAGSVRFTAITSA